jgi:hypothetical protein
MSALYLHHIRVMSALCQSSVVILCLSMSLSVHLGSQSQSFRLF